MISLIYSILALISFIFTLISLIFALISPSSSSALISLSTLIYSVLQSISLTFYTFPQLA
jgi:hypothetical protein